MVDIQTVGLGRSILSGQCSCYNQVLTISVSFLSVLSNYTTTYFLKKIRVVTGL